MSTTIETQTSPILVTSPDGTRIAAFVSGRGRPLVIAHGTTSDHTSWSRVASLLGDGCTVFAVDRRGRGASGDADDYSLEREYEDLAAVIDAAAARWGGPVDVLGHSYGGNIAFGAALRTPHIRRLVLYEGWPVPDVADRTYDAAVLARLDDLLARGLRAEALEAFYREVVHLTDPELDLVRESPAWPARVATAPTVPREIRAFGDQAFDPLWAARIRVPVLLLVGSESPDDIQADPEVVAAALPDARIEVLQGEAHIAQVTAPEVVARVVLRFLVEGE